MKLFITSSAELDLEEIEAYISEDNPSAAVRFLDSLAKCFKLLAEMPGIGRRRDNFALGVRSLVEGEYVIIYRVKGEALEILRILNGARDPERVIEETPIED